MALCIMSKCGYVCVGGSGLGGVEEQEEHYGFMHNVEMWGWGEELAQVDFRVGYDIPKNVGMTMVMAKGEAWCFSF